MRKRKYLIGASLGVIGALVVSGVAYAGVPTVTTLNATVSPSKLSKKTFRPATIHNIIATTYSDFNATPGPKETIFKLDKDITLGNGSRPGCPLATLQAATTTTAVNASCQKSVVGTGTNTVNNGTSPLFPGTNPVLLVQGSKTTLYVWTRIGGVQTLALVGKYSKGPNTLDVTGLPNVAGVDLTNFDTTFLRQGNNSYVKARCSDGKFISTVSQTYQTSPSGSTPPPTSATSKQKCKGK
jgi:hypothetical protein